MGRHYDTDYHSCEICELRNSWNSDRELFYVRHGWTVKCFCSKHFLEGVEDMESRLLAELAELQDRITTLKEAKNAFIQNSTG